MTNCVARPDDPNGFMQNRIRELRKTRKLSQSALGERVGMAKWDVSRLESGEVQLKPDVAQRIAKALDVPLADVLGLNGENGFSEDATPYVTAPTDPLARLASGPNQSLYTIRTNVLDELGLRAGDVVSVDISAEAVKSVKSMASVIVQIHDPKDVSRSVMLVRQFVPPNLLITNSRNDNCQPINMSTEDAHIKGVILSWHRAMTTLSS